MPKQTQTNWGAGDPDVDPNAGVQTASTEQQNDSQEHPEQAESADNGWGVGDPDVDPNAAKSSPDAEAPEQAPIGIKKSAQTATTTEAQPADTSDYENMGAGEVALRGAKALPSSIWKMGEGIASSVAHPMDTLNAIGGIGSGLLSKAKGAIGVTQDPKEKAEAEKIVDAIGEDYKQRYGSMAGFKKALATDPATVLSDAATVLGGGAGAIGKVGAVGKIGALEKAGALASKAAGVVDPVQLAMNTAGKIGKVAAFPAKKIIPEIQSVTSGVPLANLKLAAEFGASKSPEVQETFKQFMRGDKGPDDVIEKYQNALNAVKNEQSSNYVKQAEAIGLKGDKGGLQPLSWNKVDDAVDRAREFAENTNLGTKDSFVKNEALANKLDDIQKTIDQLKEAPAGSKAHTIVGFDELKKKIDGLLYNKDGMPIGEPTVRNAIGGITDAIKTEIKETHPEYAKMMDDYADAANKLREVRTALGNPNKNTRAQMYTKLMISNRKGTQDHLMKMLSKKDPTLMPAIAGASMSEWKPSAFRSGVSALPILFGGLADPTALAAVAGTAAMGSPRLMGNVNYKAGQLAGKAGDITKRITPYRTNVAEHIGQLQDYQDGTRPGHAKGGVVKTTPEQEADRLIREADKAKKNHGKDTKRLMSAPDHAIVRALEIAKKHI